MTSETKLSVRAWLLRVLVLMTMAGAAHGASIQKMVDSAKPGETVTVPDGIYDERVYIKKPLVVVSEHLHGAEVLGGIEVRSDDVTIEGFYIRDIKTKAYGLGWRGGGWSYARVKIAKNRIERVQTGIMIQGDDWVVEDNVIRDLRRIGGGDVDYTRAFGRNLIFRRNEFGGTLLENVGKAHVDGLQSFNVNPGQEIFQDAEIYENVFSDMHQGILVTDPSNLGTMRNIHVHDNAFIGANGIQPAWGVAFEGVKGCRIENNLFHGIKYHAIGFREISKKDSNRTVISTSPTTGAVARRNIITWTDNAFVLGDASEFTIEDNVIYRTRTTMKRTANIQVNPHFDPVTMKLSEDSSVLGYGPHWIQPDGAATTSP